MLTNATLTRIDRTGTPDATGRPRLTTGDVVSIRCALDMISGRQRYTLGAVLEDATQVVYIEHDGLSVAAQDLPANGDRLVLLPDGYATPHTVAVITTGDRLAASGNAGGLSHAELFVRKVLS